MADELISTSEAVASYLNPTPVDTGAQAARQGVALTISRKPDYEAELQAVSKRTGVPVESARADIDTVKQQAALGAIDFEAIAKDFPATTRFLSVQENAAIAHDKIPELSTVERIVNAPWAATKALAAGMVPGLTSALYGIAAAPFELASQAMTALGQNDPNNRFRILPQDPFKGPGDFLRNAGLQVKDYAKRVADLDPNAGDVEKGVLAGFQSLGQNLPAMAAGIATMNPQLVVTSLSAIVGGDAYLDAREKKLSPTASFNYGLGQASIEAVTEAFVWTKLLSDIKVGTPFFKTLFANQLREQPSEQIATVLQDLNTWATLNPEKPFSAYVEERPSAAIQTAIATLVAGTGFVTLGKLQAHQQGLVDKADKTNAAADALKQLLEVSKDMAARAPDTYAAFVQAANPEGAVYVNAATFSQAALAAGVDIAKSMPETAAAMQDAINTNSDVRIPLGEFASAIPGTTMEQSIIPLLRTDPTAPTQAELADAKYVEEVKAQTERILAEQNFNDAWKESAAKVQAELLLQLNNANRFTADVNTAKAAYASALYATQAQRLGITPEEMYARAPLDITSRKLGDENSMNHGVRGLFADTARQTADAYMKARGLSYAPPSLNAPLNQNRAARIAQAYEDMLHAPDDPEVKAAYRAMIDETLAQWQAIKATGLKVEFIKAGQADPYAKSPRMAIEDVNNNNHLWVYPTTSGFGSDTTTDVSSNPLLEKTDEVIDGHPLVANDVFRIVHDYFGHIKDDNGFRARGEENAWRAHSAMYSPLARRAMTSETRGQNSWVNFGPYGETNRTANAADTRYATQKTGLMPAWTSEWGRGDEVSIREPQADAAPPVVAVHYSKVEGLSVLEGARNGTGILGAEQQRLKYSKDDSIKKRVYFYEMQDGKMPEREVGLGTQAYQVTLSNLYDFTTDPRGILPKIRSIPDKDDRANAMESAVVAEGFDGYKNRNVIVVLGADVPVQQMGGTLLQKALPVQDFMKHLTPSERKSLTTKLAERIAEHMAKLPSAKEMAAIAHAGRAKRGWYSQSARAIADVFGPDAPQFAQLLAAMSPQTSVESNLKNALNTWANWIEAGRPRDRESIIDVMAKSVEGNGARDSVLGAWINNSVRALQYDEDVINTKLSGPKVNSFYRNLIGETEEITLDTWMANYALVEQKMFSGTKDKYGVGQKGTGYKAYNARVREAAKVLTKLTGEEWTPSEVQETVWSWAKTLYELSENKGQSAVDTLKAGELTHELVNSTPDFSSLFTDPRYADILRDAGYANEVNALTSRAENSGRQPGEEHPAEGQAGPFAEKTQRGFELAAAKRLDQLREQRNTLSAPGDARGQITFSPAGVQQTSRLALLANANLSTFFHEMGHFYLELLTDMAAQPNAPAEIVNDLNIVLKWFGVTPEQWRAMTLDEKRVYHEQFARGNEAYLFEGKAPSLELQPLFRRFRAWLLNVYQQLTGGNKDSAAFQQKYAERAKEPPLQLTDEVRGVLDRMLATNNAILEAESARNMVAVFDTKPADVTDEAWKEYQALGAEATQEAVDLLQTRSLRDMKYASNARSEALKKLQSQADAQRRNVRAEVAAEVRAEPVYQALRFLRTGKLINPQGEEVKTDGSFKLNAGTVQEMYDPASGNVDNMPDLSRIERLTAKDGLNPDNVAGIFGFNSGDELVRALASAEPQAEKIAGITDQRMLERYGDLADPQSMAAAADEAVHNEVRARFVATELHMLEKALGQRKTLIKAAKDFAATMISRKKVRDIKPHTFAAAEARAARAANAAIQPKAASGGGKDGPRTNPGRPTDDLVEAAAQKRAQLVNGYAAREARAALAEVERGVDAMRQVTKGDTATIAKTKDVDVVMAARAILAEYGIGTKGKTAQEYLKAVQAHDPAMYEVLRERVDALQQQAATYPASKLPRYMEMPLEDFRGLRDEIAAMMHLARRSRQMEVDGDLMDRQDIQDELRARMEEIGIPDTMPGQDHAVTQAERRLAMFQTARAALRRVESWVGVKDGGALMGPFRRYVWQQVKDAADAYRTDKAAHLKKYHELLDAVAPSLAPSRIAAPELGYTFGYSRGGSGTAEILHAILHTGNASNKRKLLLGRGWGTENPDGTVDTSRWDAFIQRMIDEGRITKAHYDFAQGVWDMLEATKPLAQKTHRDVFGFYFAEVTAESFSTPFGTYSGGYVPALADPEIVTDAKTRALMETENQSLTFAFPSTNKGFTKSRVEYNRPLLLDLRVMSQHLDKVLLFSHMEQPIRDVRRILTSKNVAPALNRIDPAAFDSLLTPWLMRSAQQQAETPVAGSGGLMRFFSVARSRAGMAAMFANLSNTVQQVTGLSTALVKVPAHQLLRSMVDAVKSPREFNRTVAAASPYMASRMANEVSQLMNDISDILLNPSVYEKAQAWTNKHAYFLQSAVDNVISPVVWMGAYNNALEKGEVPKDASRIADGVVRETQGSMQPEEISRVESGNAFVRLFTQFAGYFNTQANMLGTAFAQNAQELGVRKGAGRAFYIMLFGFLAPAWTAEFIAQLFKGGPDDEDKDGEYLDDWFAAVFGFGTLRYGTAMVPVAGQIINAGVNTLNSKPYDDRISTAPAISMIESAVRAPQSVYKAIVDDGKPSKAIKDTATLLSLLTGLPLFATARPAGYVADVVTGKTQPTGVPDAVRGAVTGISSPQSKQ